MRPGRRWPASPTSRATLPSSSTSARIEVSTSDRLGLSSFDRGAHRARRPPRPTSHLRRSPARPRRPPRRRPPARPRAGRPHRAHVGAVVLLADPTDGTRARPPRRRVPLPRRRRRRPARAWCCRRSRPCATPRASTSRRCAVLARHWRADRLLVAPCTFGHRSWHSPSCPSAPAMPTAAWSCATARPLMRAIRRRRDRHPAVRQRRRLLTAAPVIRCRSRRRLASLSWT